MLSLLLVMTSFAGARQVILSECDHKDSFERCKSRISETGSVNKNGDLEVAVVVSAECLKLFCVAPRRSSLRDQTPVTKPLLEQEQVLQQEFL